MAVGTFIAGRYAGTYNALDVGLTQDGYKFTFTRHSEPINQSDAYGRSTIELIDQGGDCFCAFICLEYKAGPKKLLNTFTTNFGTLSTPTEPISRLGSDLGKAMVLTAQAGTPAAVSSAPLTATAASCMLANGFSSEIPFGPVLRRIPIRLQVFPTLVSSSAIWYVEG